jgi:hypothetical protein
MGTIGGNEQASRAAAFSKENQEVTRGCSQHTIKMWLKETNTCDVPSPRVRPVTRTHATMGY